VLNAFVDELYALMKSRESAHLEFKEAKNGYDSDKLTKYCCAIANEGGGKIILGVTDKIPRKVVGSQACRNPEKAKADLTTRLHIRIEVDELIVDEKRVVLITVPSRPIGVPLQYQTTYWMRRGEELASMTPDMLKRIFNEAEPDFSAIICPNAKMSDLDEKSIATFRQMWIHKSGIKISSRYIHQSNN
jgi:ATP-dependent DNA helicase RecG